MSGHHDLWSRRELHTHTKLSKMKSLLLLLLQGSRPGCDEASSHALLDRFILELGGNFIDTSDVYQLGVSESIIGRWMEKHPSLRSKVGNSCFIKQHFCAQSLENLYPHAYTQIILATKVWGPMDKNDVNARGLSRHHIMTEVEQSLSRLRTDYIDLYQVRACDLDRVLRLYFNNGLLRTSKLMHVYSYEPFNL